MTRRTIVLFLLVCASVTGLLGCGDDPTKPRDAPAYSISTALWLWSDPDQIVVTVERLNPTDPSAGSVVVTLDGGTNIPLEAAGDSVAFGSLDVSVSPGQTFDLSLRQGETSAACALHAPGAAFALDLLAPADGSTIVPGVPLPVSWSYEGANPDEFEVNLVTCQSSAYPHGLVHRGLLPGSARGLSIAGSGTGGMAACRSADLDLIARNKEALSGPLAATGSQGYVVLASVQSHLSVSPSPYSITGRATLKASLADENGAPTGSRSFETLDAVPVKLSRNGIAQAVAGTTAGSFSFAVADGTYRVVVSAGPSGPEASADVQVNGGDVTLPEPLLLESDQAGGAPSPFPQMTDIRFQLANPGPVTVKVESVSFQPVRSLVEGNLPPGSHSVIWDGRSDSGEVVPDGVYWVRLTTTTEETARIVVKESNANEPGL